MSKSCDTCKHFGNNIVHDPCRGCYVDFTGGCSNWEPRATREVTPDWYQAQAMRTAGEFSCEDYLLNAALGLCGESGEVADIIKKVQISGALTGRRCSDRGAG